MTHRSPTTIFLHRARLIFVLASLVPTVLMTAIGIILVGSGESKSLRIVTGILVLAFCAMALTGYLLGTYFVTRGANLAAVQNEFLSSVSHELRTPLTSILMFIDTLREDRVESPQERQRCLAIVHQELTRLDGLVGNLIQLSKIESRPAALERSPVRVDDVVGDALAAFEAMKLGGDAQVHFRASSPIRRRNGNRAALSQAVGNLLSNAWKFTKADDKKIDIRAQADLTTISISVSDNGSGIPRLERDAIFEKFERGQAAVDAGRPGSGLGLAIVRAVVEAHRGRCGAFLLPARPRRELSHRFAPVSGGGMSATASPGALVTIVEDDSAIAEGLALNLKLSGYRSLVIGDGETALPRVIEDQPDLVLLDITLPRRSGLWVLEQLRQRENHVPVIVLSARQDESDKVAALSLGADDYITKPFTLAELLARVGAVLRRSRLGRAPGPPPPEDEAPAASERILRFGDVVVDLEDRTVRRLDQPVKLTHLEFELLSFFCRNRGRVYTREELLRHVWGSQQGQARTVDNFVAQLRAKLENDPEEPRHLLTVRGSGYRFAPS